MVRPPFDTGMLVSGGAHGALLLWLVVGNVFGSEPPQMEVQAVSVISAEEFAALTAPVAAPEPFAEQQPAPSPQLPTPSEPSSGAEQAAEPEPPVQQPERPAELAAIAPDQSTPPPPADRVAPEPTPAPPAEAREDDRTQDATDEAGAEEAEAEPQDATAPPASTTELVTDADAVESAPAASLRPRLRPAQTAQAPTPVPPAPDTPSDPLAEAIAEALASGATPPTPPTEPTLPVGPPLTGSELEGLRVSVAQCWNVGQLSTEAQDTRVTVYVAMNEDGTPQIDTIRMLGAVGGRPTAADRVFQSARRAIIRCGARGFPLPREKYAQWREIEMTFDPEGMFWR